MSDILILSDEVEKKQKKPTADVININIGDEVKKPTFIENINNFIVSFQKVQIKDKVVLFRLLATMINAGISLVKAISILERQEKNPVLKKILKIFQAGLKE